ncbi:(13S,14R)-1,13-dihydroxy-N-methylcanadine 13-O-acetyltransferase AT1-like [Actinidia eriantha]|uniref:(13S,14R)-1,13-dihydroxy-N-methylcanadine 13-O-acetyltransferase AT1-like n=1 Tax=Actinidia eriantha TaxID=165200 RepID=UPI002588FE55|nr:(13S,14R)-1,13-dihydroxy-N-methylcanadine 13-O-acetyltransferase AT1-like [Actinidia eriantha]
MNMKVQVLSSKVIKPSIPTPPNLKNYKISFLDQLATPVHFGIIFFFLSNGKEDETANEMARRCDHLEESLSETLTRFYPLAGRFLRDKSLVECHERMCWMLAYPKLYMEDPKRNCWTLSSPTRLVWVVNFLTDWSATNCKGPNRKMISGPSFEVASLFPGRELMGLKPVPTANSLPARKLVTKSFVFDGATISSLKAEVDIEAPSRVLAVTAHMWTVEDSYMHC